MRYLLSSTPAARHGRRSSERQTRSGSGGAVVGTPPGAADPHANPLLYRRPRDGEPYALSIVRSTSACMEGLLLEQLTAASGAKSAASMDRFLLGRMEGGSSSS